MTSVSSDLGGGGYGHIGLRLSSVKYETISDTPYVCLVRPEATPLTRATNRETIALRDDWKMAIRLYREINDLQKAIIRQTTEAIDKRYLRTLFDIIRNTITQPVPDISDFLFQKYEVVEDKDHRTKEEEVRNITYNIMDPITNIFNEIEDLAELVEAADNKYSDMQQVKFGLEIIKILAIFSMI